MQNKFASHSFQAFTKNEIGYVPTSPKCKNCSHFKEIDADTDRDWVKTCNLLGPIGLIIVDAEGRCDHFEMLRAHCVTKGSAA